ncbi:MAG: ABC transporter substrate-binding protein [Trichocoleus desertorum ATA4-8-CV12]|jgi:branched-chain amino acid transport system substrate-binding protein|nr:ABC transporter substrate-binding protein [Trichocoleus desertorum ATA4-8-CV12]
MSPKNETTVLAVSLLITLGLLGAGAWWLTHRTPGSGIGALLGSQGDRVANPDLSVPGSAQISFGAQSLTGGTLSSSKQQGMKALAQESYDQAVANFTAALQEQRNDPETLIFLNNARIGQRKSYAIAVVAPVKTDLNGALEIFRGVAQAQSEINQAGGINGAFLRVAIANDDNDPDTAKRLAANLVENQQILGVVGHYSSDVTLATKPVYADGELVAISPVSTSVELSASGGQPAGSPHYVFRTVPSDYVAARALADYMLTKLQKQNAVVFFNSQSNYSKSLKSEFVSSVLTRGGQVMAEIDLSDPSFSAAKSIEQALKQNAEVLMLAANTSSLDRALQVVQLNRQRLSLLGGDDVYTPKTLEIGGDAAVGMVLSVPWHIDGDATAKFPSQSRQLWGGDVNWRTALAYDATQALIAGLQRNPTRAGVQQTLSSSDFSTTGASGTIRFLPSGDRNASVQLVKIVPGQRSGTGYDFVPVPLQ